MNLNVSSSIFLLTSLGRFSSSYNKSCVRTSFEGLAYPNGRNSGRISARRFKVKVSKKYKLLVNNDKMEYTTINRKESKKEEEWRSAKKVGSLLGDEEDINRRKQLATARAQKHEVAW